MYDAYSKQPDESKLRPCIKLELEFGVYNSNIVLSKQFISICHASQVHLCGLQDRGILFPFCVVLLFIGNQCFFCLADAVHTLICAILLLNTDLHGEVSINLTAFLIQIIFWSLLLFSYMYISLPFNPLMSCFSVQIKHTT